ncbi:MAG: hypothetical protein O6951_09230, partial [Actinobacteria bacterium]|nr:hypothetical protein [Actinomycetota bacterium]
MKQVLRCTVLAGLVPLMLVGSAAAWAQGAQGSTDTGGSSPAPESVGAPGVEPIPLAEVASRAEEADREMRAIKAHRVPVVVVTEIREVLASVEAEVLELEGRPDASSPADAVPWSLDDLHHEWSRIDQRLHGWERILKER